MLQLKSTELCTPGMRHEQSPWPLLLSGTFTFEKTYRLDTMEFIRADHTTTASDESLYIESEPNARNLPISSSPSARNLPLLWSILFKKSRNCPHDEEQDIKRYI